MDVLFEHNFLSLMDMLNIFGHETVNSMLKSYKSVFESDTEIFLKEKAIEMERRDISRTYIAFSDNGEMIGYVTLSIKCFRVPDNNMLSGKTMKRMNVESHENDGFRVAQSYLLGQLSRSKNAPKGLGKELLDVAFDKLKSAKNLVGCRTVRLDCHDELIPYYMGYDFKLITKNEGQTLNQMMAFV